MTPRTTDTIADDLLATGVWPPSLIRSLTAALGVERSEAVLVGVRQGRVSLEQLAREAVECVAVPCEGRCPCGWTHSGQCHKCVTEALQRHGGGAWMGSVLSPPRHIEYALPGRAVTRDLGEAAGWVRELGERC